MQSQQNIYNETSRVESRSGGTDLFWTSRWRKVSRPHLLLSGLLSQIHWGREEGTGVWLEWVWVRAGTEQTLELGLGRPNHRTGRESCRRPRGAQAGLVQMSPLSGWRPSPGQQAAAGGGAGLSFRGSWEDEGAAPAVTRGEETSSLRASRVRGPGSGGRGGVTSMTRHGLCPAGPPRHSPCVLGPRVPVLLGTGGGREGLQAGLQFTGGLRWAESGREAGGEAEEGGPQRWCHGAWPAGGEQWLSRDLAEGAALCRRLGGMASGLGLREEHR